MNRGYLPTTEGKDHHKRDTELIDGWLRSLGEFEPSSKNDIKLLIENAQTLAFKEQDKIQHIMGYQKFEKWLGKPKSSVLCLRAETAPEDIINFMSVSTAMLAMTLGEATGFVVLSCFCSLRKKASLLERDSGALAIVNSLNGQLLRIMLERQPPINIPFDQNDKVWNKSTESFTYSCALLKKLLALLPPSSVVFVLLDSVSRTSGDKGLVDDLVERIWRIGRRSTSIVVKTLVTDPVPSSRIREIADFSLHVPDDVDG